MSSDRWPTRAAFAASKSCYDKFRLGLIVQDKDLCCNCFDYKELHIKQKPQEKMGHRFQCRWPEKDGVAAPEVDLQASKSSLRGATSNKMKTHATAASRNEVIPEEAKTVIVKPMTKATLNNKVNSVEKKLRITEEQLAESQSKRRKLQFEYSDLMKEAADEKQSQLEVIQRLKNENDNLKARNEKLKEDTDAAEGKIVEATSSEKRVYKKLSALQKSCGIDADSNPYLCSASLLSILSSKGVSDEDTVVGFLDALCEKKKTRQHIISAVLESKVGNDIKEQVELKFYKTIQEKFAPWKCLLHLDLEAAVSFRGLNVIRSIDFYGEEKKKYRRGIIKERTKLSRIARELESYDRALLPYELTSTSVRFDIKKATTYLLKKFKLWEHVINQENVLLAVTVDGGQLAWKLTQISAGIKIVDERSVDP
jgi:hypothetical protein